MVDIGTMFSKSWEKFSANMGMAIGIYVVGALVGGLIGALTLGILGIPIFAGLFKAFRNIQQGKQPEFGDLFSEFSNMGKWFMLWVVMIVVGIAIAIVNAILAITGIGMIIMPFVGIAVALFLFFTFPLMIDKNLAAFDAVKESINKVKNNFGGLILPIILAIIVAEAGGIVFGIGALFTGPWMMIAFWIIYDAAYATSPAPAAAPAPDPSPTETTQD